MRFVRLEKGCFTMGTPKKPFGLNSQALEQAGYKGDFTEDERPAHQVCVAGHWMGQYEVRADEWMRVMNVPPPVGKDNEPAAGMTWLEATEFARRLTTLGDGSAVFRLPTEAEWERACLADKPELVTHEADVPPLLPGTVFDKMWARRQFNARLWPVGSRAANTWGLHDMRGNVAEWVADAYVANGYKRHALYDPVVQSGRGRVLRGGSYRTPTAHLRCAERMWNDEAEALPLAGLRLVRVIAP